MQIIIDRLEGTFAVVELPDGRTCDVPRALFPGAAEGDLFTIEKNEVETEKRKKQIQEKFDRLKRK